MDRRDGQTWVVIELTRAGELRAEEGTLESAIREALGVDLHHPVFVPSAIYNRGGRRVTIHLMEGYVFVGTGLAETTYFTLERDSQYVKTVLSSQGASGMRALSTIPDSTIEDMRRQLREQIAIDLEEGMTVRVAEGVYSNLPAEILEIRGEEALISIELRSRKIITQVPAVFLDPSGEELDFEDDDEVGQENQL